MKADWADVVWRLLSLLASVGFVAWGIHCVRKGNDVSAAVAFVLAAGWVVELNADKAVRDVLRRKP